MLLTALAVSALAAQGSAGLMTGTVRYAHVDGPDTSVASGPLLGAVLGFVRGPWRLGAEYAEGALAGDEHVALGSAGVLATVYKDAAVGLALSGFAHIAADATVRRWWGFELQTVVRYRPPATALTGDIAFALTPIGGVNNPRPFRDLLRLGAGLGLRLPSHPITVHVGYTLRRGAAGTLHDVVETVNLSAIWTF